MKRGAVCFAPTLAAARRAAARAGGPAAAADAASPRSTAPLVRALAAGGRVVVADPAKRSAAWERAKKRVFLPPAPGLLRDAIGGIAVHEAPSGTAHRGGGGPNRAHWIPGDLTDARAAGLLASPPVPPLWIVEDFRRLRLSPGMMARIEGRGIRLAAYRALVRTAKGVKSGRKRARRGRIGR